MADLILPAAGWGEKEGILINSERRIGLVKKVARAPGKALSDFSIFKLVAQYWGCADLFKEWVSPAATFQILKRLSKGQPCDISGITDYAMIEKFGGIQWPFTERDSRQAGLVPDRQRRLFADGLFYHGDKRARLLFDAPRPMEEPPDKEFPFILLTGRGTSSQWHTGSRTDKSEILRKLYPASIYVEINPDDAECLGIEPNDPVLIRSRRATVEASAHITGAVQPGQIFVPMHYAETNLLKELRRWGGAAEPAVTRNARGLVIDGRNLLT